MTRRKDDSVAVLRERAEFQREQFLGRSAEWDAEIATYWPGGSDNPETRGRMPWIRVLVFFGGLAREQERIFREQDAKTDAARQAALDAVRETPERVELFSLDESEQRRVVTVYPKSDVALCAMHEAQVDYAKLLEHTAILETVDDEASYELRLRALHEQSYLQRLLIWIATTPPVPNAGDLPFPEGTASPALPEWLSGLSDLDFYVVAQASQRVNVMRLAAFKRSRTVGESPDWSMFYAMMEKETGTASARLARDRSLGGLIAVAAEMARAHEEAKERAKREHGGEREIAFPTGSGLVNAQTLGR